METIFDHDPTAAELSQLFLTPQTREQYVASAKSQDAEYALIASLYTLRGDSDTAARFAAKIRDRDIRLTVEAHDVVQSAT